MRLMHFLNPGPAGGLERVVEQLAIGRARQGRATAVAMTCFTPNQARGLEAKLRASGVKVVRIAVNPRDYWGERQRLAGFAKVWKADVIHSHGYRADLVSLGLARTIGAVALSTAHGFTGGPWRNRAYENLQRLAWRSFHAVAAVSEPLRSRLIDSGVPASRVTVVRNAWAGEEPEFDRQQARHEFGVPQDGCWIGWVGRLSAEKGPDLMIRALANLPDSAGLVMVGEGRERAALEQLAQSLGVASRVRFAGIMADAGQRMKAFDLLVLSSRTEGTPLVLLEAMAARVPIVATRVGGVPDLVNDREAYLAEPDTASLTKQLRLALADPMEASGRARAARERLEGSPGGASWIEAYERLYRQQLAGTDDVRAARLSSASIQLSQ